MTRRKLAAGNWKMNGLATAGVELEALIEATRGAAAEVLICPPATLIAAFAAKARGRAVANGGQGGPGPPRRAPPAGPPAQRPPRAARPPGARTERPDRSQGPYPHWQSKRPQLPPDR